MILVYIAILISSNNVLNINKPLIKLKVYRIAHNSNKNVIFLLETSNLN